jgi:hypothetical protein
MEEGTSMQVHIDKFWMIRNQLTNIDHQVFDEDLAFTLLGNLSSSFHNLVVSLNTRTNQVSMELMCGQLL